MELSKAKGLILMVLLCVTATVCRAQTFAEWFNQKKTQIKYLTQQIVALNAYRGYVEQGYQISKNGLGTITNWTKGDFDLHSGYYNSLKTVNPALKDNAKTSAIAGYANAIPAQFDQVLALDGLNGDNRPYVATVRNAVLKECNRDIDELELVMTSGKAEMTDDERFKRIDQVYGRMKDKYAFTLSYCNGVKNLLLQKTQDEQNIQTLRRLYGIN
ncbi:hypothetical protein [Mucilaginibacter sp.]|uniref:hypothetical protein n=1 Tax=Mucilaginibacter sp. TaxID=1882438 RepID=UPI00326479AC